MTIFDLYLKCANLNYDCNITVLKDGKNIYSGDYSNLPYNIENLMVREFYIKENSLICKLEKTGKVSL